MTKKEIKDELFDNIIELFNEVAPTNLTFLDLFEVLNQVEAEIIYSITAQNDTNNFGNLN